MGPTFVTTRRPPTSKVTTQAEPTFAPTAGARSGDHTHEGWSPRWPRPCPAAASTSSPTPPTGRRGRPRKKGKKLAKLADLACTATFTPTAVHRYGADRTVHTATISCLWYTVFGPQPVTVVLGTLMSLALNIYAITV